jgi:cyclophilin family peptidyl-prolyl cis-trans isomerase
MALNEKGQAAKGQRSVSYRHCRAVRVTRDFLQFGDTTPAADGRGQDTVVVAATATQPATGTLLGVAAQDKNAPPALSVGGGSLAPANATGNPVVLAVAAASCPSALAAAPLPLGAESAATQAAIAQAAASMSVMTASAPGASRAGARPGIAPGALPGAQSGTPYPTFEHEATGAVRHAFGVVSLASSGPNSAGSQFCIVVGADPDAVTSDAGGAAEYAVAASALADLDRRHVSIGALVDSAENRAALRKLRDACAEVAAAAAASASSLQHHQRDDSGTADGDLEESSGYLDRPLFATHAYDEMLFSGAGPDVTPATASVGDVRIPLVAHGFSQQVVIRDCGIVASA